MSSHNDIPELDTAGLRKFGWQTGAIIIGLFGILIPWLFGLNHPKWPWVLGLILIVWGFAAPNSLNPVYKTWMKFGLVIGGVMNRLILGFVFFIVIFPVAIWFKAAGKDPMRRTLDKSATTYRNPSQEIAAKSLERTY
jgi:predicted membrane protein